MATYVTGRMVQEQSIDTNDLTQQAAIPPGAVMSFAMSAAPVGWLPCDGAAISRTTYSALFNVVKTIHGAGDGSNTFNVPDLRGEFIRGWDNGRAIDSGRVFGQAQGHSTAKPVNPINKLFNSGGVSSLQGGATAPHTVGFIRVSKVGEGVTPGSVDSPGSGSEIDIFNVIDGDPETRPRNIALLYCIKF